MLPFRITVTQLRIGILILSLLLATGIFAYGAYNYYRLTSPPQVPVLDLAKLRDTGGSAQIQKSSSAGRLQSVAGWLQPSERPPPPEPKEEEKPSGEEKGPAEPLAGELAEGPLGDLGYQYVSYLRVKDDPLYVWVILEKKADAQQPGARLTGGAAGRPPTYNLPARGTATGRPQPGAIVRAGARAAVPGDRLRFRVGDRRFRDPTLNLDFWIHAADEERFVYWTPEGGPKKLYALKYVPPPGYLREPEKGLRPTPPAEGAGAVAMAQEAAAQPAGFYGPYDRDRDLAAEREAEYRRIFAGEPEGPIFKAEATGYKPGRAGETEGAEAKSPPPSAAPSYGPRAKPSPAATSPTAQPSGSGVDRRPPTEEEMRQLKDTMAKMPPDARAELEKALRGPGTPSTKR